jgi:hypothetical protein
VVAHRGEEGITTFLLGAMCRTVDDDEFSARDRGGDRIGLCAKVDIELPVDHRRRAAEAPVGKGGIVVFSSLSPHLTGPNTTPSVRKTYILQYAPDGAAVLRGDTAEPPTAREPANDPDRQFPILVDGRPA